jgi:NitT/TauT family transport system permease protein
VSAESEALTPGERLETVGPPAAPSDGAGPALVPLPAPIHWFGLRRDIPPWAYRSLALAGFMAVFAAWTWLSHTDGTNPIFLPTPEAVWKAARALLADEKLWLDLRLSFFRVTSGFLLATVMGVPLGLWMGSFKVVEGLLQPLTEFVRYIPVPALIPILMVVFGIDELSKVTLIWVGTFFQLVLMVADEVRRVPYELLQVSYTLGARRGEVIRRVVWPAARPGIFDALRLCNGWAWTYVVVAELVAANEGLGYRILKFSRFLQTPQIWVYVIFLGLIGLALDFGFRALNRRLFRWADTTKR